MFDFLKKLDEIFILINKIFNFNFNGLFNDSVKEIFNGINPFFIDFKGFNKADEPFLLINEINSLNLPQNSKPYCFYQDKNNNAFFQNEIESVNKKQSPSFLYNNNFSNNFNLTSPYFHNNFIHNLNSINNTFETYLEEGTELTETVTFNTEITNKNDSLNTFYKNNFSYKNETDKNAGINQNEIITPDLNIDSIGEKLAYELLCASKNRTKAKYY